MRCYWCEGQGAGDRFFHENEMQAFHLRCWSQINGLGYRPPAKKYKAMQLPIQKEAPFEEAPQCLCKAGAFNPICPYNLRVDLEAL